MLALSRSDSPWGSVTVVTPTKSRAVRGVPQVGRHTRLGPREDRGLLLLVWAGFLTTSQLAMAAGYPTVRRAQRRLRVLLDHGLTRSELQSGALHLSSLHVPTRKAVERLVEDGRISADDRMPRLPRAQKRAHALLIRDTFAALAAAEVRGALRLDDFRFDSDLTREEPFRAAGLIPDGIATVSAGDSPGTVALEVDTGNETTTTLRMKFAKWRAILDVWHPTGLTLLVVAEREGRRQTLARLMSEARIGEVGVAMLAMDVHAFVASISSPDDLAARGGRTERRVHAIEVHDETASRQPACRVIRVLVR